MPESFLGLSLDGVAYRCLWLDALTAKVRGSGRIVKVGVVVATAVSAEGQREILRMDMETSEDSSFWLALLRSLATRGSAAWNWWTSMPAAG